MKTKCQTCWTEYDDEFRSTLCPHPAFLANDGNNEFLVHSSSLGPGQIPEDGKCTEHPDLEPEAGFGLAGGGYGAYTYCGACGKMLSKTMEPIDEC